MLLAAGLEEEEEQVRCSIFGRAPIHHAIFLTALSACSSNPALLLDLPSVPAHSASTAHPGGLMPTGLSYWAGGFPR